jgi:hypothetical protein
MKMVDNGVLHSARLLSDFLNLSSEQTFQIAIAAANAPYTVLGCTVIPPANAVAYNAAIGAAYTARAITKSLATSVFSKAIGHDRGV